MSNISDLSGDEREQRIAELKKKMQEAAAKSKAEQEAAEVAAAEEEAAEASVETEASVEETAETVAEVEAESAEVVAEVDSVEQGAVAEADAILASDDEPVADEPEVDQPESDEEMTEPVAVAAEAAPVAVAYVEDEKSEEEKLRAQMNRREFLTYTWGAAMGLLLLGSGVATFQFMYPRFKAGEFGGAFLMGPESAVPPTDAAPQPVTDGKFWWINTEEDGPQALYMVCTHLGCLYKWVDENYRFECPCHGSKFTRDGLYIEGPAPRSLDTFETELVDGVWVVDTGAKINGAPASESAAAGTG